MNFKGNINHSKLHGYRPQGGQQNLNLIFQGFSGTLSGDFTNFSGLFLENVS